MRNLILLMLMGLACFSCDRGDNPKPANGSLSFSYSQKNNPGGRTMDAETPAFVYISAKNSDGNAIFENKKLSLLTFGHSFVSESIQLKAGSYSLTQFHVADASGKVLYSAPLDGSEYAQYVKDPLPIHFTINKDEGTQLTPQVIAVKSSDEPAKFGYANFGFDIVELPRDIPVHFLVGTLPWFETKGYDTVRVVLQNGTTTHSLKLKMISPIEATGTLSTKDLKLTGLTWQVTVTAWHEAIDEVLFNLHQIENKAVSTIKLENQLKEIKITKGEVSAVNENSIVPSANTWSYTSHLTDTDGFFHLIFENDYCEPKFRYDIFKPDIYYLSCTKMWKNKVTGLMMGKQMANANGAVGTHIDNTSFSGIDCATVSPGAFPDPDEPSPDLFFYFYDKSDNYHYCYLVWKQAADPYDPSKPAAGGRENTVEQGYFKLTTLSPEALARKMKTVHPGSN